jgi:hypothetical protein
MLQRLVCEFGRLCERRKLSANVGKSKVIRVTRREHENNPDSTLNGIRREEVPCFWYLCVDSDYRHGGIKSELKHVVSEGEKVSGVLKNVRKEEGITRDVKSDMYEPSPHLLWIFLLGFPQY